MKIARFEPWGLMNLVQRELEPFANDRHPLRAGTSGPTSHSNWAPAVDIAEDAECYILRADLPGVDPEEIDISMEKDVLTLCGERRIEAPENTDSVHRSERISGKFQRRFSLPDTTSAEGVSAKYGNGVLEISIPKQAEVQAHRINVEAA